MTVLTPGACLIDGAWVGGDGTIAVRDPADDALIGHVPDLGAEGARRAITAAADALPAWRARPAAERGAILRRLHDLMLARADDLAAILTAEQGKPIAEALGEIRYAAAYLAWFAEEARRAYGEIVPAPTADRRIFVIRQPVGVVAAITPWNFPAAMVTRKIAPALAAGCTIVVKPAEQTPMTALAIAALAVEAGVPAGVLNVVTGDARAIGGELTASATVRKLSFTGSTAVGSLLYGQCAPTIKKLSLELGGNAPFIVFDDADPDEAAAGAIASKFRNTGQTCVCANRFLVQSGIHDAFVASLTRLAGELVVGRGDRAGTTIGPLIDDDAVAKVEALVDDALVNGARGGRVVREGRFVRPLVLTGVTPTMRIVREEIFGPVAAIVRFDDEREAIAIANDSPFGLAAYLYTADGRRAWRVGEALEVGMVGVNIGLVSTEVAPFGGVKASGLGREGARQGLDDYLETKTLSIAA